MDANLFFQAVESGQSAFPQELSFLSAKTLAMFQHWTQSFRHILDEYDVLEVESQFEFPLLNPDTEAPSRTFVEAGKIDGVLRKRSTGAIVLLEHKTTSDPIETDSDYWDRLVMDSQISKYILSLRQRGYDCRTVLYDVLHKPGQRPAQIPLVDADGVKIVLDCNGDRVTTKDGKKFRQTPDSDLGYVLQSRPETPEEFFFRVHGEIKNRPEHYFVQREFSRSDSDILEYMNDAWAQGQGILYNRQKNLWPRNPSACTQFGTCEYFALCAKRATVDGIRYGLKKNRHEELDRPEGDTKDLLTNSRLSALRKCARYGFLKYEQPTEAIGVDREPLIMGTMFHTAAETFLKHFVINK